MGSRHVSRIATRAVGSGAALLLGVLGLVTPITPATVAGAAGPPPSVTIEQKVGQADPTGVGPILFTIKFSEPVSGFDATKVVLSGTAPKPTNVALNVTPGDSSTFELSVFGMTGPGTVIASIPAGVAKDADNNLNLASTSVDNTVTFSAAVPTVTINQKVGQADPTTGDHVEFTAVFSRPVTGFNKSSLSISGTAAGDLWVEVAPVAGTTATYNVVVSGMLSTGTVTASIRANVVPEQNSASTSTDGTVTYNRTAPTVALAVDGTTPTEAAKFRFLVDFSQAVQGFDASDVVITGTAPGTKTVTVSPFGLADRSKYSVSVQGVTDIGSVTASIPPNVVTGGNAASATRTIDYVRTRPTVTLNQKSTQLDPTSLLPVVFTARFSEPIQGFTIHDIVVANRPVGTTPLTLVQQSSTVWDVRVGGPTGPWTVSLSMPENAVTDLYGNTSTASTSTDNTVTIDPGLPTVTVNQATSQADPTSAWPIHYTVAFSRAVTGFTSSDLSIEGTAAGTKTAVVTPVAGAPGTYDVAVSGMTSSGSVGVAVPGNVVDGGNAAGSWVDAAVTYNRPLPTVTINQATTQVDPTVLTKIYFTATFSEGVDGFTGADVTVTGTATGTKVAAVAPVIGSPGVFKVAVSGMTGTGSVGVAIPANIVTGGNTASTSTDRVVTYNPALPRVTINQKSTQADPATTWPVRFTVVFDKAVTGFSGADVTVGGTAGGTKRASVTTVTGVANTYEVAVTGMTTSGTIVASIPANVVNGGNVASTSTDAAVTFNRPVPTVTINQAAGQADPTSVPTITFTAVFSQAVAGFTASDVVVTGTATGTRTVTVAPAAGNPGRYTVTIRGLTGAGTVLAAIRTNSVTGGNAASTSVDNQVTLTTT
jgi:hypothetical protein